MVTTSIALIRFLIYQWVCWLLLISIRTSNDLLFVENFHFSYTATANEIGKVKILDEEKVVWRPD